MNPFQYRVTCSCCYHTVTRGEALDVHVQWLLDQGFKLEDIKITLEAA